MNNVNKNLNITEVDDMSITPHLVLESLPELLKDFLTVGKTTQERDILLLSALTTLSSAFPRLYMRYGHTGKVYYTNLQTFIMAGAASGKGIANLAEDLVRPIHESQSLLIPGDSTYPAFYEQLLSQNGEGLMFETEGSVITDIWKSGCTTYNTALRKAAEHETLSKNRLTTGESEIVCPKVSMLLTGTFDQFRRLVPSVENGYFSRLNMLVLHDQPGFDETVFCPSGQGAEVQRLVARLGQQVLRLHDSMTTDIEFCLTQEQASRIGVIMKKEYAALLQRLGSGFHATIIRNGVSLMRIAALLTLLRNGSAIPNDVPSPFDSAAIPNGIPSLSNSASVLSCSDADFHSAVIIATKLLHHAAEAYQQIGGTTQPAIPEQKSSYQKEVFLATLPDKFSRDNALSQAQVLGIPQRTMDFWLHKWKESGVIILFSRGVYRKVG